MAADLQQTPHPKSFWLIKSEPETWSFTDQKRVEVEPWNGVRNYLARNNIKAMRIGDLCFFYHSVRERRIVGIVEVVSDYRIDPTDEKGVFGLRDMRYVQALENPVSLDQIKTEPRLKDMVLLKQSRLSVQPVEQHEWEIIMQLSLHA